MVTHLTTNLPVHRLSTAERTGSAMFDVLWSYVEDLVLWAVNIQRKDGVSWEVEEWETDWV